MRPFGWIVAKDVRVFAADRNGALLTVVTPVVLAALLSVLFGPRDKPTRVDLLVVDLDQTDGSEALVRALEATDSLAVERAEEPRARERIAAGDAEVALILPQGAGAALEPSRLFTGQPLDAPLLVDPSASIAAGLTEGLLTQALMAEVARRVSDPALLRDNFRQTAAQLRLAQKAGLYDGPAGLLEFIEAGERMATEDAATSEGKPAKAGTGGFSPPLRIAREDVIAAGEHAGFDIYAHNFAGMICMFLLFLGAERAKGLIEERAQGTLARLRSAPIGQRTILLASATSTLLLALLVSLFIFAVAMAVFGVRLRGSIPGFAIMLVAQATFVAGFSLFLTGVGRTAVQVSNLSVFIILVMSFLGGAWMPAFLFPEWVQGVSRLLPTYWATHGLAAMTWRGLGLSALWVPAGVLFGAGALLGWIGLHRFRWD
jgi:ABC-2 type transport system permease protein